MADEILLSVEEEAEDDFYRSNKDNIMSVDIEDEEEEDEVGYDSEEVLMKELLDCDRRRAEHGKTFMLSETEQPFLTENSTRSDDDTIGHAKIQRVPTELKLGNPGVTEKYFTPRVISIGPIHAETKELAMRELKLRLAIAFMEELHVGSTTLFDLIKHNLAEIKGYYEESVLIPFNDDQLARLFLLDGCFVLQYIWSSFQETLHLFRISEGLKNGIDLDIFLLENQLPMYLLTLLGKYSELRDTGKSIFSFVGMNAIMVRQFDHFYTEPTPAHLLDMLRRMLLCPIYDGEVQKISLQYNHEQGQSQQSRKSFLNVQDLKAARIEIKPSDSGVSFSTDLFFNGEMGLPEILVDYTTALKLWNSVVYEMCLDDTYNCDFRVSSYMYLMHSLVESANDVRDLEFANVLTNQLYSDEEVASMFNEIGLNLVNNDNNSYRLVKYRIKKHCERRMVWWVSQAWKVVVLVAVVATTIVLLLTAWFTVKTIINQSTLREKIITKINL